MIRLPTFAHTRVPRLIHHIWLGSDPRGLPRNIRAGLASFRQKNEAVVQLVWSDEASAKFVDSYYPWFAEEFSALTHVILRADLLRYMVLNTSGGVYSDVDTTLLRAVDGWIPTEFDSTDPISLIVGVEADADRDDWSRWYARRLQWCQWTIGAEAGHPVLGYVIEESVRRLRCAEETSAMELTGSGVWTDSINRWLEHDQGRSWTEFLGLTRAVRVGDAALLTITAFSPGLGHMGSGPTSAPSALVEHKFRGSWK